MIELNRKEKIMSDILKSCPFCGGEVDFWTREAFGAEEYQALIIDCKDCPANMEEWVYKYDKNFAENFEKKKVEMFEAWNKRTERIVRVDGAGFGLIGHCHDCGTPIMTGKWKYCPSCGSKLVWGEDNE